jgi:hypothetical protein
VLGVHPTMKPHERDQLLIELRLKVEAIEKEFVSRHEFLPIKTFVYGIVSVTLLGIMGGLLKMVIL